MVGRKTIFISSFFGLISRNILSTDALNILKKCGNLRIVIFVNVGRKELYEKNYGGENVFFEEIESKKTNSFDGFINSIFLNSSDTVSRKIHRLIEKKKGGKYLNFTFHWILSKLSHFKLYRFALRSIDNYIWFDNRFAKYFDTYKPDLVFSTDIFEPNDISIVRAADRKKIPVLGMIRSWDNITTKGLNRVLTDKLVVNTPKIKDEAIKYCDFKSDDIFIVGIPHYDAYVTEPRMSKNELFKELNLDPNKKAIFFAAPSDIYTQGDSVTTKVINTLSSLDAQIILRLYIVGQVNLGNIKPIPNKMAIDDPGSGEDFNQADLTGKDSHLADLLYYSDVVVAFASTVAIDAIVFNKPVVFVGFDGKDNRPYWQSLRRFYDYDHQKSILDTGGVRLAKTPYELEIIVRDYLLNPDLDKKGRSKIMEERCWKLDGKSGERLAEVLLRFLEVKQNI